MCSNNHCCCKEERGNFKYVVFFDTKTKKGIKISSNGDVFYEGGLEPSMAAQVFWKHVKDSAKDFVGDVEAIKQKEETIVNLLEVQNQLNSNIVFLEDKNTQLKNDISLLTKDLSELQKRNDVSENLAEDFRLQYLDQCETTHKLQEELEAKEKNIKQIKENLNLLM